MVEEEDRKFRPNIPYCGEFDFLNTRTFSVVFLNSSEKSFKLKQESLKNFHVFI